MIIYENDNLNDISNNKNSYNEIMMTIMPRSIRTFKPPLPPSLPSATHGHLTVVCTLGVGN